jgi:uncharacterized protein YjiS (DUF1127 family)
MVPYTQRSFSVAALLSLAGLLSGAARRTRLLATALDAWAGRRGKGRMALKPSSAMSERELQDIGISRSDVEHVASDPLRGYNAFRID